MTPTIIDDGQTATEDPEHRAQWIKTRQLQIAATLAEWKRDYFVNGTSRPFADRVTLEAEGAQLALEARMIGGAAMQAKVDRRRRQTEEAIDLLGALTAATEGLLVYLQSIDHQALGLKVPALDAAKALLARVAEGKT